MHPMTSAIQSYTLPVRPWMRVSCMISVSIPKTAPSAIVIQIAFLR